MSSFSAPQLHAERNALTIAHNKQWLATASLTKDKLPVDCILGPAAAHVAPPHGQYDYLGYTNVWNVLDYPASVRDLDLGKHKSELRRGLAQVFPLPGRQVEADPTFDKQAHLASYAPINDLDRKNWERCELRSPPSVVELPSLLTSTTGDPNVMRNAPICLQITTRRLEEEKNVGIMYRLALAVAR